MQIYTLSNIGKRENQEDFILAENLPGGSRLFIVNDGVGGWPNGEIASSLSAKVIAAYFTESAISASTADDIVTALKLAEEVFDAWRFENNAELPMATTLTLLHLYEGGATIAHAGDSRVYQVRDGNILFKTSDHSYVNELVESGFLSPELARQHPKRNLITRALSGTANPVTPEIKLITGIEENDYFILCTDGILECITDEYISQNFKANTGLHEIVAEIDKLCLEGSNDNFSGIFIKTD